MNQLVSILYICESCRKIKQLDVSANKLKREGDLFKVKDIHANHEAILYLSPQFEIERVMFNPPPPPIETPIIKTKTLKQKPFTFGLDMNE